MLAPTAFKRQASQPDFILKRALLLPTTSPPTNTKQPKYKKTKIHYTTPKPYNIDNTLV